MNWSDYAQMGVAAGIGVFLVRWLAGQAKRNQEFLQTLITNHLEHNTRALTELTAGIKTLTSWLRANGRPDR